MFFCSVVFKFSSLQIAADVVDAVRKTFVVVVKHSSEGKVELSNQKRTHIHIHVRDYCTH